jgi:DNA mismatch repair protein MSH2
MTKLKHVLEGCDIVITERKRNEFVAGDVLLDLDRLLASSNSTNYLGSPEYVDALGSVACLIRYLDVSVKSLEYVAVAKAQDKCLNM